MWDRDDEELEDEELDWDEDPEDDEDSEHSSFVCEDCDYRWDESADSDMDTGMHVCPMCGSVNVTQL